MPEGRYVEPWEDFHVLPGVPEAVARLNRAGLRVIVVSNQRGIALGLYTAADVDAIHAAFQSLLSRTAHTLTPSSIARTWWANANAASRCRDSSNRLSKLPAITAATSLMIGDSLVDIEFGRLLGDDVHPDRRGAEQPGATAKIARECADFRFPSLAEAVNALLGEP